MRFMGSDNYTSLAKYMRSYATQEHNRVIQKCHETGDFDMMARSENDFNKFLVTVEERTEKCEANIRQEKKQTQHDLLDVIKEPFGVVGRGETVDPEHDAKVFANALKETMDETNEKHAKQILCIKSHLLGHINETVDTVYYPPDGFNVDIKKFLTLVDAVVEQANIPVSLELESEDMKKAWAEQERRQSEQNDVKKEKGGFFSLFQ